MNDFVQLSMAGVDVVGLFDWLDEMGSTYHMDFLEFYDKLSLVFVTLAPQPPHGMKH